MIWVLQMKLYLRNQIYEINQKNIKEVHWLANIAVRK